MHILAKSSFATVLLFTTSTALSQVIEGDDIILTDLSPSIAFDDTDSPGNNWVMRGDDTQLSVYAVDSEAGNPFVLFVNPSLSSVALGWDASATGSASIALGNGATATAETGHAFGTTATASGFQSMALGYAAQSQGNRSTALGYRAFANQADTVILGATAGVNGAFAYANIGVGTSSPVQAVDVERSAAAARFQLSSFTANGSEAPQYIQRRARGTTAAPTAVQANDNLGLFSFRGYNGASMGGSRATITAQAAGNFSNSSTPTRLIFATTPVGSTTPQQVLVITPDGKVQVNGSNLNVPDYVFEDDYPLMPLEELQTFIEENGHLPGVASADEVNAQGLDLAGSQMGLLQKVEELTLYTLQQEAELRELRTKAERIDQLETQLAQVLARLD